MLAKPLMSIAASIATTALIASTVAACGGSSAGDPAVVKVGNNAIIRADVNHWMSTVSHEDYFAMSAGRFLPPHLVSDPAQYPACVSQLEAAAARSPVNVPPPPGVRLLAKCRELYQALRLQATGVLVTAAWYAGVAHDMGVTASDAEVNKFLNRRDSELQADDPRWILLHAHQISHADELLEDTQDVLYTKVQGKLNTGGSQAAAKLLQAERQWTAKTICQPGYVVPHCAQYNNQEAHPSASVLMEQVAALSTGRCVNRAACSKQ